MSIRKRSINLCAVAWAIAGVAGSAALASPPVLELVLRRDPANPNGVPGCPGEVLSSTQLLDNPGIDNQGNVVFRALLDTSGAFGSATIANRGCIFYGGPATSANPIHLVARDGSQAWPHLANINTWNTNTLTNGTGLRASPVISPNGTIFCSATLNGPGATSSNNTSFWTGVDGGLAQVAQQGFLPGPSGNAPGTAGALWASAMNLDGSQLRVNNAGQVFFQSTLTGGDTDTTNDSGLFIGNASGITMVARKGMGNLPGLSDPTITLDTPISALFENGAGEVGFVGGLTPGSGGLPVDEYSDSCVFTTIGGSLRSIAREGDVTPWDASLTFAGMPSARQSPFAQIGQAMSDNHSFFTVVTLGGAAPGTQYCLAKYHWDPATHTGAWTPLVRQGDPCPLVAHAVWGIFNYNNTHCTPNDGVTWAGTIADDGSGLSGITPGGLNNAGDFVPGNDGVVVYMSPGGRVQFAARAGSLLTDFGSPVNLPGLPDDATFSAFNDTVLITGGQPQANARGQMTLNERIEGTGIYPPSNDHPSDFNDRGVFAWDPIDGLMLVARCGTAYDGMGNATTISTLSLANGEGGSYGITDNGWAALRILDSFGNGAAYRVRLAQCATADFNNDGDVGTDADIEAFFACLAGSCCHTCPPDADFNRDGDVGTDADIEAFFRVLAGGPC